MKKEQLIKELEKLPSNTDVCIVDWRQNIYFATADEDDPDNGKGIHDNFEVDYLTTGVNKPFASISFKNTDYTDKGDKI